MARRAKSTPRGCDAGVRTDTGDPSLPVVGRGVLSGVRKSKHAPWRATVLIAVHVVILAHATHFLLAGRTLSPVEPSESMYTLELGELNAGFVFFLLALASTLLFGRFFCGWGCHIVALQDLCGWMMKKLGIRPRPFRSRLLLLAPMVVAIYMFVWPSLERWIVGAPEFPGLSNHFMTTGFWDTFPGPVLTVLTMLTCGFAAVYLLGAKGFCSYGCPYGAFFGIADQLSPGRIVVSDACEQCGHCTATCTSNVRVHEEVRLYGMVVDPGCMKCTDCISVCPKNALSFGLARPALWKGKPRGKAARRFSLGWGEEVFLFASWFVATLVFRGLYDGPPLLMSVALGGITAYLMLKSWHLFRRPTVRVQNLQLKVAGGWRPVGAAFALVSTLWLAFASHSAFVQWHRAWGRYHLDRTEATQAEVMSGAHRQRTYSGAHHRSVQRSARHFRLAERWGLSGTVEVKQGLAWDRLLAGDHEGALELIGQAIDLAPGQARLHQNRIELLLARGRFDDAANAMRSKMERAGASGGDHFALAGLLVQQGDLEGSVPHYEAALREVGAPGAHYNLGGVLRRLGRPQEAVEHFLAALDLVEADPATHVELALAYVAMGDTARAVPHLERAVQLDPDSPETRYYLKDLLIELQQSTADAGSGDS